MKGLSQENFFFFYDDCSNLVITPNSIEHAYLAILNQDLVSANAIFNNIDSPRARWGRKLIQIFEGFIKDYPTYFEIRNFLEIDMDFLIKNNKIDYVEQILGSLEFLSTINQETYKFVGRVMYENRLFSAAYKYMERSKDIYYNDPELHFMFAKYYVNEHNYDEAYFYINECIKMLSDYYPALLLKQQIEEMMF